jgi:hypothetical protein
VDFGDGVAYDAGGCFVAAVVEFGGECGEFVEDGAGVGHRSAARMAAAASARQRMAAQLVRKVRAWVWGSRGSWPVVMVSFRGGCMRVRYFV